MAMRTVNGGMNGRLVQLYVRQLPVLNVIALRERLASKTRGNAAIDIDAYTIQSNAGRRA